MENLKSLKTLRIITLAVLIYAVLVVFSQLIIIVSTFVKERNPLIPEELSNYIVFPIYFLMPIFIAIIYYCYKNLLQKTFNYKIVIGLAVFSILYFSFGGELYVFIQNFHSYSPK